MTAADNDDFEKAADAIPAGSVRLSDAYSRILDVVLERPDVLPPFDEEWLYALEKSREFEKEVNDPEVFDDDLADFVHQQKRANIFLRQCLEERQLVPCVRDPETGQTLELPRGEWLPSEEWCEFVPRDIIHDYIIPNDYEAPGPPGSLIRGKLRPVFFERASFEAWFEKHFGTGNSLAHSSSSRVVERLDLPKAHKLAAVKEAILARFGSSPDLRGINERDRNQKINDWLVAHGKDQASNQTIRRAIAALRIRI